MLKCSNPPPPRQQHNGPFRSEDHKAAITNNCCQGGMRSFKAESVTSQNSGSRKAYKPTRTLQQRQGLKNKPVILIPNQGGGILNTWIFAGVSVLTLNEDTAGFEKDD